VGDSADGYPGIPGWGAKSASTVLSHYGHLEQVPDDPTQWQLSSISAGRAASLAQSLASHREEAYLFRQLARLREDVPMQEKLSDLQWRGALPRLKEICTELGDEKIPARITQWR
jgi:5'-3' exonuclease